MIIKDVAAVLFCLFVFTLPLALAEDTVWTFQNIEVIDLSTVSGDCVIEQVDGDEITVRIEEQVEPAGCLETSYDLDDDQLNMNEEFICRSSRGSVVWYLSVPSGTEIRFSTASGDLEVSGLEGDIYFNSASGDASLKSCSGEYNFNTASGDVDLRQSEGDFWVSTASGDIHVEDCDGEFQLASASGDIDAPRSIYNKSRNVYRSHSRKYD
jgi:DUF4097 and DUF4098 domain-containing protein YvlB